MHEEIKIKPDLIVEIYNLLLEKTDSADEALLTMNLVQENLRARYVIGLYEKMNSDAKPKFAVVKNILSDVLGRVS